MFLIFTVRREERSMCQTVFLVQHHRKEKHCVYDDFVDSLKIHNSKTHRFIGKRTDKKSSFWNEWNSLSADNSDGWFSCVFLWCLDQLLESARSEGNSRMINGQLTILKNLVQWLGCQSDELFWKNGTQNSLRNQENREENSPIQIRHFVEVSEKRKEILQNRTIKIDKFEIVFSVSI